MSQETAKAMRERDLRLFALGYAAAMQEEAEAPSEYAHRKANEVARFLQVTGGTSHIYSVLKADWDHEAKQA